MTDKEQTELFASRLNQALMDNKISARALANKSGISEANISRYRKAYAIPSRGKIISLAAALHVSSRWLLGFTDDKEYDLSPEERLRNQIDNLLERMNQDQLENTMDFIKKYIVK